MSDVNYRLHEKLSDVADLKVREAMDAIVTVVQIEVATAHGEGMERKIVNPVLEQRDKLSKAIRKRGHELLLGVYDGKYSFARVIEMLAEEATNGNLKP